MDYDVNEGDGAFYGPKIDFHLEDCLGRTWQCGTVQLDFQMPLNFNLEYVDADGTKKRPIMMHRVCFGSIERFIGILIEHFAGKFPTWLAPVQVKALPVSEKSRDYATRCTPSCEEAGIRVSCDDRNEKIGYKIREARSSRPRALYADPGREGGRGRQHLRPRPLQRDRSDERRRVCCQGARGDQDPRLRQTSQQLTKATVHKGRSPFSCR